MRVSILLFIFCFLLYGNVATAQEAAPASNGSLFDKITSDLMCLCGCKSTMKTCPHSDCGFAVPARKKVTELLALGQTYDEVVDYFIKRDGETILAKPRAEGFNLIGYILPFVVILTVGFFVVRLILAWADRGNAKRAAPVASGAAITNQNGKYSSRLERELLEFDED